MPKKRPAPRTASGVPSTYQAFIRRHPALGRAHDLAARGAERAGPLDRRTLSLVKVGISLGAGLESALRSHVRRALANGATPDEVEQAILLGMTTVGFPRTVAAWSWAREQFTRERDRTRGDEAPHRRSPLPQDGGPREIETSGGAGPAAARPRAARRRRSRAPRAAAGR